MPLALTCPKCNAPHTVPDESAGQSVECPNCQATFAAEPTPPESRDIADPTAGSKWGLVPWVVLLVLLVGAAFAAYQFLLRSNQTEFTDPEGVFSARFPNPTVSKTTKADPSRLRWGERVFEAKVGRTQYDVSVVDGLNEGDQPYGPTTRDSHINSISVLAVTNGDGKQLFERAVTHEGHTARETVFVRRDSGKLTAVRVLAGEKQALRLAVTGSGDKDKPAEFLDQAGEFFNGVRVGPAFGPPITEEPPTVPAADLASAYKVDAKSADAKYKDKWLRVTGTVREVSETPTEFLVAAGADAVLVRRTPPARQSVQLRGPGSEVTLVGKCRGLGGEGATRVLIEDAIVVRPSPAK